MKYEINVALDGQHFFATAERSLDTVSTEKAYEVYRKIKKAFPAHKGYEVTITKAEAPRRAYLTDTELLSLEASYVYNNKHFSVVFKKDALERLIRKCSDDRATVDMRKMLQSLSVDYYQIESRISEHFSGNKIIPD